MIQVRSATKTYGKRDNAFQALRDISLEIPDGATVAIIGKSGSGKSTLMHVMSSLEHPETGEVYVEGQNVFALKQKQIDAFRSKTIGFIFQSFFVQANESCYDNVSLPLEIARVPRDQRKTKIDEALNRVGLLDKAKQKAGTLSGGQKQRLAISRAIVNTPRIIFADEPTGNLDSATGETVEQLLFDYNKNSQTTLIIVTHDPDLAAKCGMQVRIKDGQIEQISGAKQASATQTPPTATANQQSSGTVV